MASLGPLLLAFALRMAFNVFENIHLLEASMFILSLIIVLSCWRMLEMLTIWQVCFRACDTGIYQLLP